MPRIRIRLINSSFESSDEAEFASLEIARKSAIATATSIVGESIAKGETTSAVEIQIFDKEMLLSREVVVLSVSELVIRT